jgi:hypothetical protein
VRQGASIGANATILPGITIGARAMVGAGAVVMQDVPPNAIVIGNPAFIKGYVDASPGGAVTERQVPSDVVPSRTRGVTLYRRGRFVDLRGSLTVGEINDGLPFVPRRYFLVFGVPNRQVRGAHAHRELHQFFVCVAGDCTVLVDDGASREEFLLDTPTLGLHVGPMTWTTQFRFSPDAVLMVLASAEYDAADYITSYDEFVTLTSHAKV